MNDQKIANGSRLKYGKSRWIVLRVKDGHYELALHDRPFPRAVHTKFPAPMLESLVRDGLVDRLPPTKKWKRTDFIDRAAAWACNPASEAYWCS